MFFLCFFSSMQTAKYIATHTYGSFTLFLSFHVFLTIKTREKTRGSAPEEKQVQTETSNIQTDKDDDSNDASRVRVVLNLGCRQCHDS